MKEQLKYLALTGIFLGASLIIGLIEQYIPSLFPYFPFIKIGFSNIALLFALIILGYKPAYVIAILKSVAVPLFVGNPIMILYSLPAALVSLTVTIILVRLKKLSLVTVSTLSAIVNIFIQVCVCAIMTKSSLVFGYLIYLVIVSAVSGFAVGLITHFSVRKFPLEKLPN